LEDGTDSESATTVDWHHVKVDRDKQVVWEQIYERHAPAAAAKARQAIATSEGRGRHRSSAYKSYTTNGTGPKLAFMDNKIPSSGSPVVPLQNNVKHITIPAAPAKLVYNMKAVQETLGIDAKVDADAVGKRFFHTRNTFYEHRDIINQEMVEELKLQDMERLDVFQTRFACLQLSTGKPHQDMANMRAGAEARRTAKKSMHLRTHPWFKELLHKVVMVHARRDVSDIEKFIIQLVKRYVEAGTRFNKPIFIQLLSAIPAAEFGKEEVQTILRFIKLKDEISERDYVDAMEAAGREPDVQVKEQRAETMVTEAPSKRGLPGHLVAGAEQSRSGPGGMRASGGSGTHDGVGMGARRLMMQA
jgi:hypothetical protein